MTTEVTAEVTTEVKIEVKIEVKNEVKSEVKSKATSEVTSEVTISIHIFFFMCLTCNSPNLHLFAPLVLVDFAPSLVSGLLRLLRA